MTTKWRPGVPAEETKAKKPIDMGKRQRRNSFQRNTYGNLKKFHSEENYMSTTNFYVKHLCELFVLETSPINIFFVRMNFVIILSS